MCVAVVTVNHTIVTDAVALPRSGAQPTAKPGSVLAGHLDFRVERSLILFGLQLRPLFPDIRPSGGIIGEGVAAANNRV